MSYKSVTVLGLARSGTAAAQLALKHGIAVYASDASDAPAVQQAAADLRSKGADVDVGRADVAKIMKTDAIVMSPGIPPKAAPLNDERIVKMKRISELEFASGYIKGNIAAVTGTNGKSTTTAWAGHIISNAGVKTEIAGNIGNALSNVALAETQPEWVIVEASSFQLADVDRFSPRIGVVTNLAPDHLDRYDSVEEYYGDKKKLFRNATVDNIWILNGDEADVLRLPGDALGRRLYFRLEVELGEGEHGAFMSRDGDMILKVDGLRANLINARDLPLPGAHNRANALAAALMAIGTGIPIQSIREGLRSFRGLPHRMELVSDARGIHWINDSKATNIASSIVALRSMQRPTVLLLGGRHKGESYTKLLPHMRSVKVVVAYGEAAEMIEKDLRDNVAVVRVTGPFEEVIERATQLASEGDTILLSPACSSYDMFKNYEERGAEFARLAQTRANG